MTAHHGPLTLRNAGVEAMLDELATLVSCESPSNDPTALRAATDLVADIGLAHLGVPPEIITVDGFRHLRWSTGRNPRVVLIGHVDTVWPMGTLADWPFEVKDGRATGPGTFDMKAGLIQGFHALATLGDLDGVAFVITTDEETGSATSRQLIEETAVGARAALVLEPSADGGVLKTGRKGVSNYQLSAGGRAAHAGLEPESGVNALLELAHLLLALEPIADPPKGTTVTPTVAAAGTTTNTVPATASAAVDVRAFNVDEQMRVDSAIRSLAPTLPGATVTVTGGPNRPPMDPASSIDLFTLACDLAGALDIEPLRGVAVGGGSDGNFTAALGVATLDGLGAVGSGAHARHEYVDVASMPERAALVAALVAELRKG